MSKKCKAYSESKLGLAPADNRKAFYAGWDAALREALAQSRSDVEQPAFVLDAYRIETEFFGLDDNAQDHPKAEALYRLVKQPAPPPWWPAVENIMNEYGLQAIDFVADFKAALSDHIGDANKMVEQPAPPPECQTEAEKTAFAFGWWKALEMHRTPAQQQEPFGYFRYDLRLDAWVQNREGQPGTPFYTSPQPSKPLTDAQIGAVAADIWGSILIAPQSYQAFARAIEAAHGIKAETK